MTFVVELADDELCIEPIHRLVDLPPARMCARSSPTRSTCATRRQHP